MSAGRRQRESLAPSLFPFLAVLLCTMGALVLILMLIVAGAQASTQTAAAETQKRIDESEALLGMAKRSYQKQLSEGQIALEKKRLVLQHLETHIQELLDELEELKRTSELIKEEGSAEASEESEREAALSELEKQLAAAKAELNQKIDKPAGDKPIFAIIPYQGNNGTHRRPIYVECTGEGVIIQPEGVRLLPNDLRPPYGPGNPLDAALRTIRAEFPPSNGAVTSTAYPLLVVRPSGIAAYVLARAAMSGWDDQFGYELIEEDLELAFPDSTPGLKTKLTKAIDLARDRQAALVMAMPQKYRGYEAKGASGYEGEWGDSASQFAGNSTTGSGLAGGQEGSGEGTADGSRGGFNFDQATSSRQTADMANRSTGNPNGSPLGANSSAGMMGFSSGGATSDSSDFGGPGNNQINNSASLFDSATSDNGSGGGSGSSDDWALGSGSGSRSNEPNSDSGSNLGSGSSRLRQGHTASGGASDGASGSDAAGQTASDSSGSSASSGGASANSGVNGSASGSGANGSQGSGGTGSGGTGGNSSSPSMQSSNQSSSTENPPDGAEPQSGAAPSLSYNAQFNRGQQEPARPVASARGRNWAWSQGPPTETPVVRSVRMQCLADRWLILPETGSSKEPIAINFDESPRVRAEQLANVVAERVASWGIALTGGHWKPVLLVDVAPDAEWRFEQLQQLLAGSGLEVQRRVTK